MYFNKIILDKAKEILKICEEKKLNFASAESCSGGLISAIFTEISGSSKSFNFGICSYSNLAKEKFLNVKKQTLKNFGAVSYEVAREMAFGAREKLNSNFAISTTGIAGPNGESEDKKVGLVYIGFSSKDKIYSRKYNFSGNRNEVREKTIHEALNIIKFEIKKM